MVTQKPLSRGTAADAAKGRSSNDWLLALLLVIATLTAYFPCWRGQPIWDDDAHMTRADLQSLDGLARIWAEPKATQQYYPLTHSVFWLEHQLWGDNTLGYHLF